MPPRTQLLPAQAAWPHHSRRYGPGAGWPRLHVLDRVRNAMLRPPTVTWRRKRQAPAGWISGARIGALDRYRVRSTLMTDNKWRPPLRSWLELYPGPSNRRSAADHLMAGRNHGSRRTARAQGRTNRDRVPWRTTPSKHHCTPGRHGTQRVVRSH